ncbi:Argininosuccinate synthase [Caldibacillus thermoamylovorans]|jgi:argininosuccinate synthase|uniref:Argininosuccinate synthase n=1 Tax=Caldibacillus thermoamylovorans TaxID=35841 RepID=A0A090IXL2_9BACI|nr:MULTISPECIES: argininosuccinate synthase [Bacillaceae]MCB5936114.1 argininosuccinate synthase [Bacillus sp. DFI.2.34]NWN98728.1 argininosuccinate synthase [Bacillus sp. (in: firmicutes)]KIO60786.1 Argininosuccinate synthase [Caldibacillus thermoamylovorans]KIO63646.1 Argininosuccinate synthase [Caldibacillus thermoamylovorans]KIO72948.1 Argininosuccinate synthase [Caldibacillus thermoamylovorans]
MAKEKIVLAYSGGLDTSVSIKWLQEKYGYDVIALAIDVGEGKDLDFIKEKALKVGAIKAITIDAKDLLANEYILPSLKANALYEGKYPLSSALSRPLISKLLVEVAETEGAVAVAHGCTGKGNDQVRFEVSIQALNPKLSVVAPVREWGMNRDQEIAYAEKHGIPIPVDLDNPFSIDANIWGRACEAGVLENPWNEAPEEAFAWTNPVENTPDEPEYVEIRFEKGVPVALNGVPMKLAALIQELNEIAGKHGVGRIDHIENRLVGIKSREVYENPAALVLINAHKEMEFLTLPREVTQFKTQIESQYAKIIYEGLWYSPLRPAIDAFIEETQKSVTGTVKVKLFKGNHVVVARKSPVSLYNEELATYSAGDLFDHNAAVGFIKLWGMPTKVYSEIHTKEKVLK